jgi:GTP-binding protein
VNKGDLAYSALEERELPTDGWPEVVMMGRSNSGKSSLLNALLNRKTARVSAHPGHTRRMHFYEVVRWYLVDLPGFGYAVGDLRDKERFSRAVDHYLMTRQAIVGGILIQDIRRDPGAEELMLRDWAQGRGVPLLVAANKVDKLSKTAAGERLDALGAQYRVPVVLVSARTKSGITAIRDTLLGLGLHGL